MPSKRGWIARTLKFALRGVVLIAFLTFVYGHFAELYFDIPAKPSLLDFVTIANIINYILILSLGGFKMMRHEADLSELVFFNDAIDPGPFFIQLFLSIPSFVVDIYNASTNVIGSRQAEIAIGSVSSVLVWPIQYLLFLMYAQCESVVLMQLRRLSESIKRTPITATSADRIIRCKTSIRQLTVKVNRIFSEILLLIYMKVVFLLAKHFGSIALWGSHDERDNISDALFVIVACLQTVQVFETTRLGSAIIKECLQCDAVLLNPPKAKFAIESRPSGCEATWSTGPSGTSEHTSRLADVRLVLAYREQLDAMTISDSFVICKATMFTYLGTTITCIAIVLQFDCDVLNALDRAKEGY